MKASLLLLAAALVACSMPPSGSAPDGGDARGAEVLWDSWGVPHIRAGDQATLFYALGWAQMHNHADLLLHHYGMARGRGAEYWGEAFVESDRQVRTLRIPQRAQRWTDAQDAGFRALLEAFADGINGYAEAHPDRIDDTLEVVLPVTVTDTLAHQQRAGVLPFAFAQVRQQLGDWSGEIGSNAWAIGPGHSASGNPMLLLNPHIPWGRLGFGGLFQVFEVHLAAPGVDAYGSVQVGNPMISGGFNRSLGYTHTVSTLDNVDVYELELVDGGYRYDGGTRSFDETVETIRVRSASGELREQEHRVLWSLHGPVLARAGERALAVRLAGLEQPYQARQFWHMARAGSLDEFRSALADLQIPKSNLLYADRQGNVLYLAGGRIPARDSGTPDFWAGIIPGTSSSTLWNETLQVDALPLVLNPPSGWLQNANDPPWSVTFPPVLDASDFPPHMRVSGMSLRAQRSVKMISGAGKLSFNALEAAKLSTRMELADRLLDDLGAAVAEHGSPVSRRAMEVLEDWDRTADAASRGGVLFKTWYHTVESLSAGAGQKVFATAWQAETPLATPDGLADPVLAAAALEQAAADVEDRYGSTDVAWGEVHRLRWDDGAIDLPANGASGNLGAFRVVNYQPAPDGRQMAVGGDSIVMLVEFGDTVNARALLAYGNASQPGSPHAGDQLALFAAKSLRPVWFSWKDVEAKTVRRELLPPWEP